MRYLPVDTGLEKSVVNKTVNFLMKNNSLYEKIKRNL